MRLFNFLHLSGTFASSVFLLTSLLFAHSVRAESIFIDFEDLVTVPPQCDAEGRCQLFPCATSSPYAASKGVRRGNNTVLICDFSYAGGWLDPAIGAGANGNSALKGDNDAPFSFNEAINPDLARITRITFMVTSMYRNFSINGFDYGSEWINAPNAVEPVFIPAAKRTFVELRAKPGTYMHSDVVMFGMVPNDVALSMGTTVVDNITIETAPAADLSLGKIEVSQPGATVSSTDGLLQVAPQKPVQIKVPVSGTNLLPNDERSVMLYLTVGDNFFYQTVKLSDVQAAGILMVPFDVTFGDHERGIQTIEASLDPERSLREDGDLSNNSSSVQVNVVRQSAKLIATLFNGTESTVVEGGSSLTVEVPPSFYACGQKITDTITKRTIRIECRDASTSQPMEGCSYGAQLVAGSAVGHDDTNHSDYAPVGTIFPNQDNAPYVLPAWGASLEVAMPDIAMQGMRLIIWGSGPGNTSLQPVEIYFDVKNPEEFVPIDVPGLTIDVQSHPSGIYGVDDMISSLEELVSDYRTRATRIVSSPPELRSEGASLSWGGLFDIDRNWKTPHCGHRDGKTLDLSLSVFKRYSPEIRARLKEALALAVSSVGFEFYAPESPNPPPGGKEPNHWHIYIK